MEMDLTAPFTMEKWEGVVVDEVPAGGPPSGVVDLAKTYTGPDLVGTATGHALTTMGDGGASYVAQERIVGTLAGRSGSFVLEHGSRTGGPAVEQWAVVVPGSGTDALSGIAGTGKVEHGLLTLTLTLP